MHHVIYSHLPYHISSSWIISSVHDIALGKISIPCLLLTMKNMVCVFVLNLSLQV